MYLIPSIFKYFQMKKKSKLSLIHTINFSANEVTCCGRKKCVINTRILYSRIIIHGYTISMARTRREVE